MTTYIQDTQYAANGLIDLYMHEVREYKAAKQSFVSCAEALSAWSDQFKGKDLRTEVLKIPLLQQLEDLEGKPEQIRESTDKMCAIEVSLKTRQFAFQVLSGAILQIAKQGISLTYGDNWKTQCPDGRAIGTETLRNVIWQARNQAMHYEENKPKDAVRQCFSNLESSLGAKFSLCGLPPINLSAHIIDALKWHSYAAYEKDMKSLLEPI